MSKIALVAGIIVLLLATRTRSLVVQLAAELAILAAVGATLIVSGSAPLPPVGQIAHRPDGAWIQLLAMVWWLIGSRMIVTAITLARGRDAHTRGTRLLSDLAAGAIYAVALIVVAGSIFDLPVRGLLATSGVFAVVLGLALQNTLADLFAGIAVGIEQAFHVDDRISIDDGIEGVVVQMNWRAIRLRTANGNIATVPNGIVSKGRIVNYSKPTPRREATTDIRVRTVAPTQRVLALLRHALLLSEHVLADPVPVMRLHDMRRTRLDIRIGYSVATTADLSIAQDEILRNARRVLRHSGLAEGCEADVPALLGDVLLFAELAPDQIARVAASLEVMTLAADATLLREGERSGSLFIVRTGVLAMMRAGAMSGAALGRIGPGEYVGEVSMMTGEPSRVTVTAVTPATILALPKAALEAMLAEDQRLGAILEDSVRRGLASTERDTAARAAEPSDVHHRIVARLLAFLRPGRAQG